MGVWAAVVVLVARVAGVAAAPQNDITLSASGYQGVTVAINDQLDPAKCAQYVNGVQDMVAAASELVFNATDNKLFFGDVVVVVPEGWQCQGVQITPKPSLVYTWDSAHLRLGPSHYTFGDNPWTQQLGGCGEPGDWIYFPENFLLNNADANAGSPGTVLVHEWAKYRWGVFEEYGHANDPVFPAGYRGDNGTITPTYCTDHLLHGAMSCPGGSEDKCQFTPDAIQNTTITSSLLAAPFLDTMTSFCDATNHNAAAPTKHNLQCDQASVREVMARHADMKGNSVSFTSTKFSVVRAGFAWPRLVLLLDYSATMGINPEQTVDGRWEQLRDNVRQFIKEEAAAESYVGVVVFNRAVFDTYPVIALTLDADRAAMAATIPERAPDSTLGERNLQVAITRGVELLGQQGGTLILVTHNLKSYTGSQDEVEAAASHPVWPILYPSNSSVSTGIFDQLAAISPDTSVLIVPNNVFSDPFNVYQAVDTSAALHHSLLTAAASPATRVASGDCNADSCTIPLVMNNSTAYLPQAHIKVFCSIFDNTYAAIRVTDPSGKDITEVQEGTSRLFPVNTLQSGQYVVTVTLSKDTIVVMAELWATPRPGDVQAAVWSPQGLQNLPYSAGSVPRLLAKVTNGASWPVLFADVTAVVASKTNPGNSVNITLNDRGTGGDITGQDGVYSGYLVGLEPNVDVTVTLTATDNSGQARVVNASTTAAPTPTNSVACCGSQLDVSKLQLLSIGSFAFSSPAVSGRLTGVSPGTLPPGRVTDLRASRSGWEVTLTFTAPGAQLDQGEAEQYGVRGVAAGQEVVPLTNISALPAGSTVEGKVTLPECDKMWTLTVVAYYNGVSGSTSNGVRESVSCRQAPGTTRLSPGAIAGITLGCIFGILLLMLVVYLGLNHDHLDELWVWHLLTCRCCPCRQKNKEDDDLYRQPSQARRSDVIRGNTKPSKPVRDLTDLYSRPHVTPHREHLQTREDEDDGGFGDRQRQRRNAPRSGGDLESVSSSHSTLPINKVGLPLGGDNHGYDDGPYTIYRNAPPVPAHPRANTQV